MCSVVSCRTALTRMLQYTVEAAITTASLPNTRHSGINVEEMVKPLLVNVDAIYYLPGQCDRLNLRIFTEEA